MAVGDRVRVAGRDVELHRVDQLWWPDEGLRKADLLAYYAAVAPVVLHHLAGRPFTMKRYPNGPRGPCFWIKDAPPGMPDWIRVCGLPAKSRHGAEVRYPLLNDAAALLWAADWGCVDLHVWFSRCETHACPDYVLFDLDPSGSATFADAVEVALALRETLMLVGLDSVVKTTGGDGLHVNVPLEPRHSYDEARRFAEVVAAALARARPDLVTLDRDPHGREGVFVDTKMNGHGMTIACPYSARPRPGATVSTPVTWDELPGLGGPGEFTIRTVPERVERVGDPWEDVLERGQSLTGALRRVG